MSVFPRFANGSPQQQLGLVDTLSIISFVIGLMNYEENLTQSDKQDLVDEFNQKTRYVLDEIHNHLQEQDQKIDLILQKIGREQ